MTKKEKEFTELYRKYYDVLRSMMMKIILDENLSEDITQETFFRVWKKKMWRDKGFSALIIRIGTNICYDHYRRKKSHRRAEFYLSKKKDRSVEIGNPEYVYLLSNLNNSINDVIENKLSYRERDILKKRAKEEMVSGDIAKELSLSKRTVENYIYRARKKLKELDEVKEVYSK
jgi:RNA polymerase sigma factor (sigma-70 family)